MPNSRICSTGKKPTPIVGRSHRAWAAAAPDEDIALELEQSADRAEGQGGFLARPSIVKSHRQPSSRLMFSGRPAFRLLLAAEAAHAAGNVAQASGLLQQAREQLTDPVQAAPMLIGWRPPSAASPSRATFPWSLLQSSQRFCRLALLFKHGHVHRSSAGLPRVEPAHQGNHAGRGGGCHARSGSILASKGERIEDRLGRRVRQSLRRWLSGSGPSPPGQHGRPVCREHFQGQA